MASLATKGQAPKPAPTKAAKATPAKAAPAKAAKPKAEPKPAPVPKDCLCGCKGKTGGGSFLPGHDARLKSALQKAFVADAGSSITLGDGSKVKVKEYAESRGWMKFLTKAVDIAAKKAEAREAAANKPKAERKTRAKKGDPDAVTARTTALITQMSKMDSTGKRLVADGAKVTFMQGGVKREGTVNSVTDTDALVHFVGAGGKKFTKSFQFSALTRV